MPLCVLLANVYFKAFNGRHYKLMQNQLKFASYIFLLRFEKNGHCEKVSSWFSLADLQASVRMKSLVRLCMHNLCPMGEGGPPELPKAVVGLNAEDFC